jgi:hypothetical protein
MKTLRYHIDLIKDLKRQKEILSYRYFTMQCQITLLKLIKKELSQILNLNILSSDTFYALLNIEKFMTNDIEPLCLLYRDIILSKVSND